MHASVCVPLSLPQDLRPSRSALALLQCARRNSRKTVMSYRPAQQAGKRAQVSGGGDAMQATVHEWGYARVPMRYV